MGKILRLKYNNQNNIVLRFRNFCMQQKFKLVLSILLLVLFAPYVLKHTSINGDGSEYMLMTHALLQHGTPQIKASDVNDLISLPLETQLHMGIPTEMLRNVFGQMQTAQPDVVAGFFPDPQGRFYAIHFWLYSLLAVPFYALLKAAGANPVLAFALLNMSIAGATMLYLRRVMPRALWPWAAASFLAVGTSFYLNWTGPEAMAASCVLVACIATLRGELGLAMLLAGLGASQNPPLMLMMPPILAYRYVLHRYPQLRWPGSTLVPPGRRDLAGGLLGIALALAPLAFFQNIYGVPSLIAKYYTSSELVTPFRLASLFLDLDQGMIVGLPGLLCALLPLPLMAPAHRARWCAALLLILAMLTVLILPSLSATNWNSGGSVVIRYAYWSGISLLTLVLLAGISMPVEKARYYFAFLLGLQAIVMVVNGPLGERYSYVKHSALARWTLQHFPSSYNPEAEIFYERSIESEQLMPPSLVYAYTVNGQAVKLLRHWSNPEASGGLCPEQAILSGENVRSAGNGWQYVHAPFRCHSGQDNGAASTWRIRPDLPGLSSLLPQGWSQPEDSGVWSDGRQSTLTLRMPTDRRPLRLHLQGFYYDRLSSSEVILNGRSLGNFNLHKTAIDLPDDTAKAPVLTLQLRHPDAASPKSRGESEDSRLLAFHLQTVLIESTSR